jgi:hypothetical protein
MNPEIISRVQQELDFYLVELREANPWAYAVYHCGTSANMYSKIHWSYFANGNCGERYASMVTEDPELGKGHLLDSNNESPHASVQSRPLPIGTDLAKERAKTLFGIINLRRIVLRNQQRTDDE